MGGCCWLLASAGEDMLVRVWDPLARELLWELDGHTGSVFHVTFGRCPDGRLLLAAGVSWRGHAGAGVGPAGAGTPVGTRRPHRQRVPRDVRPVPRWAAAAGF